MKNIPISRRLLAIMGLGFLVGVVWLAGIRFLTIRNNDVHYHANFALYVNGERDLFNNFTFYEEVQMCMGEHGADPKSRVHMHNNKNDEVHVHDAGVTWGAFFANLGYGLLDDALQTDAGVFVDTNGRELTFILNGTEVETLSNRLIGDKDRLLISYGSEDQAELDQRFAAIPSTAEQLNTSKDPASCAGAHDLPLGDRLKRAFWFED